VLERNDRVGTGRQRGAGRNRDRRPWANLERCIARVARPDDAQWNPGPMRVASANSVTVHRGACIGHDVIGGTKRARDDSAVATLERDRFRAERKRRA
jgi:hypothetical protein